MSDEVSIKEAVSTGILITASITVSASAVFLMIYFDLIEAEITSMPLRYVPLALAEVFSSPSPTA